MTIEDQDFIMQQIKLLAKGIGALLDIQSLKELLKLEFAVDDDLTDRDIESIIYTARVEELIEKNILSEEELEEYLGVSSKRVADLKTNQDLPTEDELQQLKALVEEKAYWMD
ncbi:hypothetical protein [Alkalibacterium sp. MB6]|uniref:hypothetical protein n=1 Tax=Alkalibacterium sp. MB6 TaxID=2081965 RepID=UPI00137AD569|nr:hypothetical protein [Alkalibacterium sp. MB6]